MYKLIDRDELLVVIEDDMDVSITGKKNMEAVKKMMQNILDDVKESPVVDAVPVIRCRDCRFCNKEIAVGEWQGSCRYWNTHSVMFDDWCSRAKRKEE